MRIIKISKCEDCPYFECSYTKDDFPYVCEHIDVCRNGIYDKDIIQDFCPLEEEK